MFTEHLKVGDKVAYQEGRWEPRWVVATINHETPTLLYLSTGLKVRKATGIFVGSRYDSVSEYTPELAAKIEEQKRIRSLQIDAYCLLEFVGKNRRVLTPEQNERVIAALEPIKAELEQQDGE